MNLFPRSHCEFGCSHKVVGTLLLNKFIGLQEIFAFVPAFPLKKSHTPKEVQLQVCLSCNLFPRSHFEIGCSQRSVGTVFVNEIIGLHVFFCVFPLFPLKKSHTPKKVA